MDNDPVDDTTIADTGVIALEIFTQIIKDKVAAYPINGRSDTDLRELDDILTMSNEDMVITSKKCSDEISDENVLNFISYYNKLNSN